MTKYYIFFITSLILLFTVNTTLIGGPEGEASEKLFSYSEHQDYSGHQSDDQLSFFEQAKQVFFYVHVNTSYIRSLAGSALENNQPETSFLLDLEGFNLDELEMSGRMYISEVTGSLVISANSAQADFTGIVNRDSLTGLINYSLTGPINYSEKTFRILPVNVDGPEDIHALFEVDPAKMGEEAEPLVPPENSGEEINLSGSTVEDKCSGGKYRIDFLALYTPAAASVFPGGAIENEIALAFETVGQAMGGEDIDVCIKLKKIEKLDFGESGRSDLNMAIENDIEKITKKNSKAYELRDEYAADLVVLFAEYKGKYIEEEYKGTCGIAYLKENDAKSYGYSVSNIRCAVNYLTTVHEIGHNFGMRHDRAEGENSSDGYNFGYIVHEHKLRSIMAYDTECREKKYYCKRVLHFSSPDILVGKNPSIPIGIRKGEGLAAHNRSLLNKNGEIISRWR